MSLGGSVDEGVGEGGGTLPVSLELALKLACSIRFPWYDEAGRDGSVCRHAWW